MIARRRKGLASRHAKKPNSRNSPIDRSHAAGGVSRMGEEDISSVTAGGTAADCAERLTRTLRNQSFPNGKPRDSATLILIDRAEKIPKVLLGRRHERHRFLPGKFVFPGGRIEPADRLMAISAALHERHVAKLMRRLKRPSLAKAAAYALAAVREHYAETGIMLGTSSTGAVNTPP